MRVISSSQVAKRDYCPAAEFIADLTKIGGFLRAKPDENKFRDGLVVPKQYKDIYLELSSGRHAMLTQTEMRQSIVEICLEIYKDEFFYEEDLFEILKELAISEEYVKRIRGGFTWWPVGYVRKK